MRGFGFRISDWEGRREVRLVNFRIFYKNIKCAKKRPYKTWKTIQEIETYKILFDKFQWKPKYGFQFANLLVVLQCFDFVNFGVIVKFLEEVVNIAIAAMHYFVF